MENISFNNEFFFHRLFYIVHFKLGGLRFTYQNKKKLKKKKKSKVEKINIRIITQRFILSAIAL